MFEFSEREGSLKLLEPPDLSRTISEFQIREIVKVASLAPSPDNIQPWSFAWDGKILKLLHDHQRASHAFNRANHGSLIGFGCLLESIAISAREAGFKAHWQLDENLIEFPQARIQFESAVTPKDPLYRGLLIRATDRRLYQKGSLHEAFFGRIQKEAQNFRTVNLYWADQFRNEFLQYLEQAECVAWEHKHIHKDLFRWIRFSNKEALKTRDGMPWSTFGISFVESRLLKLCRNWNIQERMNRFIFVSQTKAHSRKLVRSSAGLGLFTVSSKNPEDLIELGRLWLRVWCCLNLNGYGLQPMSSGAVSIYDARTGVVPPNSLLIRYEELFKKGYEILQKTFGFEGNEIPVIMFRTGRSQPLPEKAKTLRLPLEKVLKIKQPLLNDAVSQQV